MIEKLYAVGRYAFGINWHDGHESIIPHRVVRRACPCDDCTARPAGDGPLPPAAEQPVTVEILGGQSAFVHWADGHDTVLLLEELRALCRCARCAGEPDYPISGR